MADRCKECTHVTYVHPPKENPIAKKTPCTVLGCPCRGFKK